MSWSNAFVAALEGGELRPMIRVERIRVPSLSRGVAFGSIASHEAVGIPSIAATGIRFSSARVHTASWMQNAGEFVVDLALPIEQLPELLNGWSRGTPVQVSMQFAGTDMEPVALGVVRDVEGVPPALTLRCWDLSSALRSRITTDGTKIRLFESVAASTTLNASYTVGDGTVTVVSTSGFEAETSGTGAIKIDNGSDAPFYLTYTGTTGTTFTGCSSTGQFGTTAANASSSDAVSEVALVTGHPMDVIRKILISTGNAAHGTYDVLPETWGFGLPDSAVDVGDMTRTKGSIVKVASGSYQWDILAEEPQDDGFGYLAGLLSSAGMWMTVRQGKLTVRAAQDPNLASPTPYRTGIEIRDEHISRIVYHRRWDPSRPVEYQQVKLTTNGGSTTLTEDLYSLPADNEVEFSVADRAFTNEAEVRTEMRKRMANWALRVPEVMGLELPGLWAWRLATGDLIMLTTARTHGRVRQTDLGYTQRHCMVVGVTPDLMGARVTVDLAILPTRRDV